MGRSKFDSGMKVVEKKFKEKHFSCRCKICLLGQAFKQARREGDGALGASALCIPLEVRLLTARPWAERGSCSARDFVTARPWAELCTGFFRFFVGDQRPKPPLGQITIGTESRNLGCLFAKSCWNNDVREMLRIMFSLL